MAKTRTIAPVSEQYKPEGTSEKKTADKPAKKKAAKKKD